ncbi:MAG: hypothetical protein Q4C70_13875 [Planctomycetia bacterium]|nr:hypothetical protein [Planctomycetia bacterium]
MSLKRIRDILAGKVWNGGDELRDKEVEAMATLGKNPYFDGNAEKYGEKTESVPEMSWKVEDV